MRKLALRAIAWVLVGAAVAYALDFSVFQVRRARGTGMGSVAVDRFLKTPLKGSKTELDYTGTADQNCSRTLFPQWAGAAWNPPCWWLARHTTQWQP